LVSGVTYFSDKRIQ